MVWAWNVALQARVCTKCSQGTKDEPRSKVQFTRPGFAIAAFIQASLGWHELRGDSFVIVCMLHVCCFQTIIQTAVRGEWWYGQYA